ncbi:hypothetical protein PGT21_018975 [Puccinia graminis f. sp. tritici]|uniref:Uncharacterized protein n=1 Tax=Puccinia graminis f. sp. tritici TaxID=56615 RepID=A0A5B0PYE1_PUCGR|nr:hypothetical protein PGT21_018975 [Puccinia graminis f. sp. tritici]KAA1135138.1 hypothetical protein PGTUg99_019818 [Puccinia graminis f. sp. tritici]
MNRWQGMLKNIEDLDRLKRTLDPLLGYGTRSHPKPNQLIPHLIKKAQAPHHLQLRLQFLSPVLLIATAPFPIRVKSSANLSP